jgi:GNAT superfamily N-acetyltransferase
VSEDVEILTVDATNVEKEGFLCYKSKSKTEGYHRKLNWLRDRFQEGMKIKLLHLRQFEGPRGAFGFIEYTPGEYAWRPVNAKNYLFVHCLWVIGRHKGKGYASRLLQTCLDDASRLNKDGVAMVSRSGGGWLAGKRILLANRFEPVDHAPFKFDLFARKLHDAPPPTFPTDWDKRAARYGTGLTIAYSNQCPYMAALVTATLKTAREHGIPCREVELRSAREVHTNAPSPYGTYGAVYNGRLLAYSPMGVDALLGLINRQAS